MHTMPETDLGSRRGRARLVFGTVDLPDTALAPRLLDLFHAGGGRALDVANVYRDGESAEAVGKWLRTRHSPDDLVVYAKGCHPPHSGPDLVASEVDRARRLLGLDRIDVFILHRDVPSSPVAAFADALLEQVAAERIGGFGVSNWTLARLRELRGHLDRIGADHLLALSNHFSLAEMVSPPWPGCLAVSKQELLALADADVKVLAWSSLATGFFAGRETASWDSPANRARRQRAAELAGRLGTSTAGVALAYVFHQPEYVLPVVGTRSEPHLDEAIAAADIELSPDQLVWLETGVEPPG
jgi:aryl-alcohol dehydrogenase-like predicted oxidoreductase